MTPSAPDAVPPPTVYVVDDDDVVRDGLAELLSSAGYRVAAFDRAEALLDALDPDVRGCVVLDVKLPGMHGPELQAELARRASHLPVLFLTGHGDVPTTVRAMRAGARDVLVKPAEPDVLLDRVAELVSADTAALAAHEATRRRLGPLTAREREVLLLLAEGQTNRDIAERLGISPRTVEVHRAHVVQKTGAAGTLDLAQLVRDARAARLL